MPISDLENRRRPPQYLSGGRRKLLLFFLKCIIMVVVISLFLFFLGFAALILLHFLFLSNAFNRPCRRVSPPNAASATSADEGLLRLKALLPGVKYSAASFPMRSDCAICLDSFKEGDECRNLPICKHLFHAKCVDKWIGKMPTCPICRNRIDSDLCRLSGSRIGSGDDHWKRLWAVNFGEGSS